MALLETWRNLAYGNQLSDKERENLWNGYFTIEKGIYEQILAEPAQVITGTVKELAYEDNSVSQYAVVEPFVDVKNVRDVFVITDFEGKGEIAITEQNKEDGENSGKEDADPTPSPSPSASPSPSPEGE